MPQAMLDLAILLAFVAYSVTVGFLSRKKASRDLASYFLAGRTLKGWQAGTSMAATQFAADTPLLVMGLVATAGVFAVWRLWIYAIAFLLMAFVFASHWQRAGVITDAELTEIRYSGRAVLPLRVFKAVYYGTVINCAVLAMVLIAAIRIAEVFLPWHAWLPGLVYDPILGLLAMAGLSLSSDVTALHPAIATANNTISILAIVGFTALYSMTGGLRSVVATDVMQFLLAIAGTVLYAGWVVAEAGGLDALTNGLVELYGPEEAGRMISFAPTAGEALLPFLVLISLQWLFQMNADGTGYLAQRSMACRSERDATVAGVTFAWLQILLRSIPWLVIALGLLVLYPITEAERTSGVFAASREILFVQGINDLLPPGARGLLLTALLAALASTLDTHLNWGASYWSNDVYRRLVCESMLDRTPRDRELVVVARLSNLLILAIALLVTAQLDSIQDAWFISLLFGAGVGSVLVLRWLWERANLWSEIAAIGASIVLAPALLIATRAGLIGEDAEWLRLAIMSGGSTATVVVVTLLTPPTDPEVLDAFYARVRPVGWWPRAARRSPDPTRRPRRALARDLGSVLLTAASLFLALYAVTRLLIPHPGVSTGFAWVALIASIALCPLWIGRIRRAGDGERRR